MLVPKEKGEDLKIFSTVSKDGGRFDNLLSHSEMRVNFLLALPSSFVVRVP
jgi:hypothetical protein